jgi:hypothetical protein
MAFVIKEINEALPAITFFAIGFNLIELTTQLVLDSYSVQFANYGVATLAALLVGKAVLLANALPFFRGFNNAPLIRPILFKTFIYWLVVALLLDSWGVSSNTGSAAEGSRASRITWQFTSSGTNFLPSGSGPSLCS